MTVLVAMPEHEPIDELIEFLDMVVSRDDTTALFSEQQCEPLDPVEMLVLVVEKEEDLMHTSTNNKRFGRHTPPTEKHKFKSTEAHAARWRSSLAQGSRPIC